MKGQITVLPASPVDSELSFDRFQFDVSNLFPSKSRFDMFQNPEFFAETLKVQRAKVKRLAKANV